MKKEYQDEVFNIHCFKPNIKEDQKINDFKELVKKHYGQYGLFEYKFTPTGIGTKIEIKSLLSGIKIDVTDYESW